MTYSYSPAKLLESFHKVRQDNHAPATTTSSPPAPATPPLDLIVAATQITGSGLPDSDMAGFLTRAEQAVTTAAVDHGATLVLLPELWNGPYFCQSQEASLMGLAGDVQNNIWLSRMQDLARRHQVVLPVSFYERDQNVLYNSLVMINADGTLLPGTYRKSHIPDGTGYQEKFYFTPGDSGFCVYDTMVGKVGVAICWDQWFPEAARAMALQGADVLLYPTAIGSEPQDPTLDSADHWARVMQGHAAANMVPVVASNRYGTEILLHDDDGTEKQRITFYGTSFITDNTGKKIAECEPNSAEKPVSVVVSKIDRDANTAERLAWGLFRDRRPELYKVLLSKNGTV